MARLREILSTRSCTCRLCGRRLLPSRPGSYPFDRRPAKSFGPLRRRLRSAAGPQRKYCVSFRRYSTGDTAFGDQLARQRNQFAAILDGVDQRIEAANKEVADAEIVIVAEHFGDLLGRSDPRGGVAVGAGEFCHFGPEALVDTGALLGQRQQPSRAGRRMTVSRFAIAGLDLQ